ncbi:MAG TPA: protein kinase, partial [Thermoanaerobaculia bacterium]
VALKFLSAQRSVTDEDKRRFLREAQAASALDHPHICTIYGIEETPGGDFFIAMAYCTGPSLKVQLERGPLPPQQALDIARQVARGLGAAHERGIVHRDVKPANLMFAGPSTIKIVDFGIAQVVDQTRLTRAGSAMGTAAYMAPEQLRGAPVDASADLWSLGVVLYEMLTGSVPWKGASEKSLAHSILTQQPPALSPLVTGLASDLDRIFAKLLARRTAERSASAGALLHDLEPLRGESVSRLLDITLLELPEPVHLTPRPVAEPQEGDTELLWTPSAETRPSGAGLASGSAAVPTLTSYRLVERLGQGGMGVVYRAVDVKLLRTVALKFLPPDLTRDPEAKERFLKEARAASALDHPNICTIHEVGETDDGQLFLSMACYEGETLQRRIERGPLPIEEAVEVAKQVAAGLAKAHRLGIVHRDVKPANLMTTDDGVVKVLDFGIAKLAGVAALAAGGSSAGTPSYMSPQQAAGEEVGPESDVWSLGAVLYEMLTGRRPFRGDTPQAVRYALENEEPVPVRTLRPETPPELARIVSRMLAKRPEERYRSLDEVLADLRAAFGPISGATETYTAIAPAARPRRSALVWAFAALAVVALAAVTYLLFRERGPAAAAFHSRRLTSLEGRETFPSLSPDGNYFVYAKTIDGNTNIFQQRVDGGKTLDLTADSAAVDTQPVYSPDGSRIAFRSERDGGGIFLMSASGESVRRLSDFGFNPAWSHDGKELVVATEGVEGPDTRTSTSELWRIDVATGAKRQIASGDAVQPSWSPNGRRIAY